MKNFLMGKMCMAKDGMEENTQREQRRDGVWQRSTQSSKLKWQVTTIKIGK